MTDEYAFPNQAYGELGMTLRDWFAGQALTGLLAAEDHSEHGTTFVEYANDAYLQADAMMERRKQVAEKE